MSLFAKGKLLGVAQRDKVNSKTGEVYTKHYLVLQSPKTGGLDGQTVDHQFLLTKRQIEVGADKRLNEAKGREVMVEVFMQARSYKEKAYVDWFVAGDAQLIGVK